MSFKQLICILLSAIGLLLPKSVSAVGGMPMVFQAENPSQRIVHTDQCPEWGDLGLGNILAVSGQTTVVPPSPVRLAGNGRRIPSSSYGQRHRGANSLSSGVNSSISEKSACNYSHVQRTAPFRIAWTRGDLYIIQCLRL